MNVMEYLPTLLIFFVPFLIGQATGRYGPVLAAVFLGFAKAVQYSFGLMPVTFANWETGYRLSGGDVGMRRLGMVALAACVGLGIGLLGRSTADLRLWQRLSALVFVLAVPYILLYSPLFEIVAWPVRTLLF